MLLARSWAPLCPPSFILLDAVPLFCYLPGLSSTHKAGATCRAPRRSPIFVLTKEPLEAGCVNPHLAHGNQRTAEKAENLARVALLGRREWG